MLRKFFILTVFSALFVVCSLANAEEILYPISIDSNPAKFWKEKFIGTNGPGETGNILMAVGKGWVFQNARLTEVTPVTCDGGPMNPCTGDWQYISTYKGGRLTIKKDGKRGKNLKASNIVATNYSKTDGTTLKFNLSLLGTFNDGSTFIVAVEYTGEPLIQVDDITGDQVYQRGEGNDMKGTILINEPAF